MRIIVSQNPVTGMQVVRLVTTDPVTKSGADVTFDTEQTVTLDLVDGTKVLLNSHRTERLDDDANGDTWLTTPSSRIRPNPDNLTQDLSPYTVRYLEQARDEAIRVYNRCGGHKLAERMRDFMERAADEINRKKGIPESSRIVKGN